eukprot:1159306-Pelagomonas_calceolata.AAC.1
MKTKHKSPSSKVQMTRAAPKLMDWREQVEENMTDNISMSAQVFDWPQEGQHPGMSSGQEGVQLRQQG